MSDNKITVGAFVLGKESLVLFTLPDASTITIPQGDRRIPDILAKISGPVALGKSVEIELEDTQERNTYSDFNGDGKSGIKLFRVAKKFLDTILHGAKRRKEEEEQAAAEAQAMAEAEAKVLAMLQENQEPTERKVWAGKLGEGLYEPKPVPTEEVLGGVPTMALDAPGEDEVLIAVTDCGQVLPNVDKLLNQFAHVNKYGSRTGLENLIKRLAHVIHKQRHSVEDVLTFVQKSDLAITDDGSIIGYKLLTANAASEVDAGIRADKDMAYDPYTRRVPQKVGTYVKVAEELIDKDRRRECSAGLHVARLGYLNSYTGEMIFMVKVAPEDIVTVPHRDPNKVRVKGYHVVAKLSPEEYNQVKRGGLGDQSRKLITAIIKGNHPGITHITEITKPMGGGVIRISVDENGHQIPERVETETIIDASKQVEDITDSKKNVLSDRHKVDPKAVAKKLTPNKATEATKAPSKADQAKALYDIMSSSKRTDAERRAAAVNLQNLKRQAKVGWAKLNLRDSVAGEIDEILTITNKPAPKKEAPKPVKAKETNFNTYKALAKGQGADDNAATAIAYLKEGKLSKSEIARKFNTSTRTLGRWLDKWG